MRLFCCVGSVTVARLIVAQEGGFNSPRHPTDGPVVSMASTQDLQSCSEGSTPSWSTCERTMCTIRYDALKWGHQLL